MSLEIILVKSLLHFSIDNKLNSALNERLVAHHKPNGILGPHRECQPLIYGNKNSLNILNMSQVSIDPHLVNHQ